MIEPAFTILLPVHRSPAMLPYAIASVLGQERQDFELFVICDGAPPETVACAHEHAARDDRIKVFAHPKGERHGEIYRHQALQQARGTYVCQIADDDLWFANHLTEMAVLLSEVDFGNLLHVLVRPDGLIDPLPGDLARPATRAWMAADDKQVFFGPSVAGYRLSAYRALPVGWGPALPGVPSDLTMWRKFVACPGLRFGTRPVVTSLEFPASMRRDWTPERRRIEVAAWAEKLSQPGALETAAQMAIEGLHRQFCEILASIVPLDQHARGLAALEQELRGQIKRLKSQLAEARARARKSKAKRRATKSALSWRLTRPFRKLARRFARRDGS